jgi:hypothetical protein
LALVVMLSVSHGGVPSYETSAQVTVAEGPAVYYPTEANLAVNTDEAEVLFTFIEAAPHERVDPITGEPAMRALLGVFFDPTTLEPSGEPFVIVGNPYGELVRHDVKYNPVSRQYVVAVSAATYPSANAQLVLMAFVNPGSTNETNRVARAWVHDRDSTVSYEDVALAVSTRNGNFLLASEYKVPGEGEGVVGNLFNAQGTLLTLGIQRLDGLQPTGDEDDPDVVYLPQKDVFFFVVNTDKTDEVRNRVMGRAVGTTPDALAQLQLGQPALLGSGARGWEGHPAAMENPFTGNVLTVFDLGGNSAPNGTMTYHQLGPAPGYLPVVKKPEILYLDSGDGFLFGHTHPQMDADPNSGACVLVYSAYQSGLVPDSLRFTVLDSEGDITPGRPAEGYKLAGMSEPVRVDPNYYNVKYEPFSDSFIAVYNVRYNAVKAVRLNLKSRHFRPRLHVAGGPGNARLSWRVVPQNFVLESKDDLGNTNWVRVTGQPTQENGTNRLSVATQARTRFFRLCEE